MRSRVTPYFLMPISDLCWNEATTEATILSLGTTGVNTGARERTEADTSTGFVFIYLHWFLGLRLAFQVLRAQAISKDILLRGLSPTRLSTLQCRLAHIVNHVAAANLPSHKFFGGFFKEFVSKHLNISCAADIFNFIHRRQLPHYHTPPLRQRRAPPPQDPPSRRVLCALSRIGLHCVHEWLWSHRLPSLPSPDVY